jgi:hypothetical protein
MLTSRCAAKPADWGRGSAFLNGAHMSIGSPSIFKRKVSTIAICPTAFLGGLDQIVVARVVSLDVPVGQTMIECQLTLLSIAIFRLARWSLSAAGAAVLGN